MNRMDIELSRYLGYWAPVYFSFNRNGMAVADR